MKQIFSITLGILALSSILMGPFFYNDFSSKQTCHADYTTSLDGLWIIKQRVCRGPLGIESSRTEIRRVAAFEAF